LHYALLLKGFEVGNPSWIITECEFHQNPASCKSCCWSARVSTTCFIV